MDRREFLKHRVEAAIDEEIAARIEDARLRRDHAEEGRLQRERLANALEGFRVSR